MTGSTRIRRRIGVVLAALVVAACSVWLLPAHAEISEIRNTDALSIINSKDGRAVFVVDGIEPGRAGSGEVTLSNTGVLSGDLSLESTRIEDSPGGRLGMALDLEVLDVTDPQAPAVVYAGKLAALSRVGAGRLPSRGQRTFRFVISLPDAGRQGSDIAGQAVEIDLRWAADADEAPAPGSPATGGPATATTTGGLPPERSILGTSTRRCVSRRAFAIRLRVPRSFKVRKAVVYVNGKRNRVLTGKRYRSRITLKGLPAGRSTVRIVLTSTRGKRLTGTRSYLTCTKKRPSKRPPKV